MYNIMREIVFTVEYERGADELIDLFIDNPDLHARSMRVHATSEAVWGINKVVGPASVLDEYDDRLERIASDSNTTGMCGAAVTEWQYEILSSNPESRKIYSLRRESNGQRSIPLVAAKHVGEGLVMRSEYRGDQSRWHLLIDDAIGAMHDEIEVRNVLRRYWNPSAAYRGWAQRNRQYQMETGWSSTLR